MYAFLLLGAVWANKALGALEAVAVGTTGITFATLRRYTRFAAEAKVDKNPYSKNPRQNKTLRVLFANAAHLRTGSTCPLAAPRQEGR